MPDALDQQVDALLRRHLLQVEAEREDDSRAAVHAPEERADAILRRLLELHVPEQQLPVERPALAPERRAEQTAIGPVAGRHIALEVMARNQFVKDCGAREMNIF